MPMSTLKKSHHSLIPQMVGEKIAQLIPGQCLRIPKEESGLARTINILCTHEGEFQLMVETKSKLADDRKRENQSHVKEGTFKKGKPAMRIDSGEIEYFNLVTLNEPSDSDPEADLTALKNETHLSQTLGGKSDNITVYEFGSKISGKNGLKMSVYSLKAEADLFTLLFKPHRYSSPNKQFMLDWFKQKNNKAALLLEIMHAIKQFHDAGYVHQDIKLENILVYYNPDDKSVHAKIADYGLTQKEGENKRALATVGYESPEMSAYYLDPSRKQTAYFHGKDQSYGRDIVRKNKIPSPIAPDFRPSKANDVWALGILAYEIMFEKHPSIGYKDTIEQDPLLSKMLATDRDNRLNIDDAIGIAENYYHSKPRPVTSAFGATNYKAPSFPVQKTIDEKTEDKNNDTSNKQKI